MFRADNKVKINPEVLEDTSVKANHHLFQEALKHNVTGTVVELDQERSKPMAFWYRVKFHFFTAPLKENQIVLFTKE
jgi:hypothetical protein